MKIVAFLQRFSVRDSRSAQLSVHTRVARTRDFRGVAVLVGGEVSLVSLTCPVYACNDCPRR